MQTRKKQEATAEEVTMVVTQLLLDDRIPDEEKAQILRECLNLLRPRE